MTGELIDQFARAAAASGGTCAIASAEHEAIGILQRLAPPSARVGLSDAPVVRHLLTGNGEIRDTWAGDDLFSLDIGVTGAQWGIAETGTLVLDSSRERNRLLSLVPPVHVALLRVADLRPTCAAVLQEAHRALGSALTFITGPSRTSDIELIPVIGVHGPQHLHIILLP